MGMHFLASQLVSSRTKVSKCFQVLWDRSVDGHVTGQSNSRRFTNLSLTILYLYKEHQDVLLQQNVDYTFTKKLWFIIHTLLTLRKRDFFFDEEAIVLPLAITKTLALELSQIGY